MITGVVTANKEAALLLTVRGPSGQEQEIETIIDTGFNGFLALPDSLVTALGLPYHTRTTATIADGSRISAAIHKAVVVWHGQNRSVYVMAADGGPLIGMALLYGNRLALDVVDGGPVTVEPLVNMAKDEG